MKFPRPLIAGLALALAATPALAKEWIVSPSGNNQSGDGSTSRPYKTVLHALGQAQPHDIVSLRAGTYNECDVRLRKPLTLRSVPGQMAKIHCDIDTPDSSTVQIDRAASGSRLHDLELTGGKYYAVMLQTDWWGSGATGTGPSDVVLENLHIHHTGRDAIKLTPKTHNIIIRNNHIHHTGEAYAPGTPLDNRNADGIDMVNVSNVVIEDNHIHDISTTGLYFKGGSRNITVQRNRIENTGHGGILAGFDTSYEWFDRDANPHMYEALDSIVRNNVVRGTDYSGIGIYAAKNVTVANNTIVDAARVGHSALYFGVVFQDWDDRSGRPASVNPIVVNNLVIQGNERCVDIRYSNELGGLHGLQGHPGSNHNAFHSRSGSCQFRDQRPGSPLASGGNLARWRSALSADANSFETALNVTAEGHLPAGSPAIGGGKTLAEVRDDIDREARRNPPSIGADEPWTGPGPLFANGFE